jgi:capsid protein
VKPDPQAREQCQALRRTLLELHRTLLDQERRMHETLNGPQSAGAFLQFVAFSGQMRWLEPLSRVIVMLDEGIDGDEAAPTAAVVAARVRELLRLDRASTDDFSTRYIAHFDNAPELAGAHAQVMMALKAFPGER